MDLRPTYTAAGFRRRVGLESDTVEFKTGIGNEPMQEALVALSNVQGGLIFVGVRDDGTVVGVRGDRGVEDRVHQAALDAQNVGRYELMWIEVDHLRILAVRVNRREEGFAQTSNGRVLERRGARNVALFGANLAAFIQRRALRRFESSDSGVRFRDADQALIGEVASAFGWSADDPALRQLLGEHGLVTSEGNLTIAGSLFLTDPSVSLGQHKATVEVRRYQDESSDYDRRVNFNGPAHQQVRDSARFVMDELGTELLVTGVRRREFPRLPPVVVREVIANAVAHRDYESHRTPIIVELRPNRVVVTSPGGLPEPVTVATLRQAQAARNQDVIDVLRRFHLAEDAGRGIDVIQDQMSDALLDPPVFEDSGTFVRVQLPLRGRISPEERAWITELERRGDLSRIDRLVLIQAVRGQRLTNQLIREATGVSETEARSTLQRLRDAGLLVQHGQRGSASYDLARNIPTPTGYRLRTDELVQLVLEQATREPLTNQAVRTITGFDRDEALRLLRRLVRSGQLRRTGSKRGTRYEAASGP